MKPPLWRRNFITTHAARKKIPGYQNILLLNGLSVLRRSRPAEFNRAQTAAGWIARN